MVVSAVTVPTDRSVTRLHLYICTSSMAQVTRLHYFLRGGAKAKLPSEEEHRSWIRTEEKNTSMGYPTLRMHS